MTNRRGSGALVVCLCVLVAAGCGDKTVDSSAIEQAIEQQITLAGTPVTGVKCPDDVKSEAGATFQCSVSASNGATGKVKVTETSRNHFQYAVVPGSVQVPGTVVEKGVQEQLATQGVENATVNCPDNIIVKVGTTVTCDLTTANGGVGQVTFSFSSSSGTIDDSSVSTS